MNEGARLTAPGGAGPRLSADPSAVQAVQLTIDALDKPSVMPLWRAALRYERLGDDDLVDAMRRDPAIWFQQMDVAHPLRNRVHLDVGVHSDLAHERVAAVKAAGGREAYAADYYVTLADAEDNEVDVAPLTPALTRHSPPAGGSPTTRRRQNGGRSSTPRATRWTSPSRWAARRSG